MALTAIISKLKAVQELLPHWAFTFISKITATVTSRGSMSESVKIIGAAVFNVPEVTA